MHFLFTRKKIKCYLQQWFLYIHIYTQTDMSDRHPGIQDTKNIVKIRMISYAERYPSSKERDADIRSVSRLTGPELKDHFFVGVCNDDGNT